MFENQCRVVGVVVFLFHAEICVGLERFLLCCKGVLRCQMCISSRLFGMTVSDVVEARIVGSCKSVCDPGKRGSGIRKC